MGNWYKLAPLSFFGGQDKVEINALNCVRAAL